MATSRKQVTNRLYITYFVRKSVMGQLLVYMQPWAFLNSFNFRGYTQIVSLLKRVTICCWLRKYKTFSLVIYCNTCTHQEGQVTIWIGQVTLIRCLVPKKGLKKIIWWARYWNHPVTNYFLTWYNYLTSRNVSYAMFYSTIDVSVWLLVILYSDIDYLMLVGLQ